MKSEIYEFSEKGSNAWNREQQSRGDPMAKQREEAYYAALSDAPPQCVVDGCAAPIAAEVHDADYAVALELFRAIHRRSRTRRAGDEQFFVCEYHREHDARMRGLRWQDVFPFWGA
jgi:hypothetical protein